MQPIDPHVYYGIADSRYLDRSPVQPDLLPDKLYPLRWKLHQKAREGDEKGKGCHTEKTGPRMCFKPSEEVVEDINIFLMGWGNCYPRRAFRDLCHYARQRMVTHLNRCRQRKYHRPKWMSHSQYLQRPELKQR